MGIVVSNVPGKTVPIVAEHALALMFAVARRAWHQTNALKQGRWLGLDNVYLRGKVLGVVGTGAIGAEMARLALAVGMKVIAWTFHPTHQRARELGVPFVTLNELLRTADVVSLHVRLTEQSRGLIGAREFGLMKPGALFINTLAAILWTRRRWWPPCNRANSVAPAFPPITRRISPGSTIALAIVSP
jgi:D-3-phosphoglycerate dehydrogenase